jgi:hypothetical protein
MRKVFDAEERDALLRGARGHWAGGAVRWHLTTGQDRKGLCALVWADMDWIRNYEDHMMHAEIAARRREAAERALRIGVPLAGLPVFPNFYGQTCNPESLADVFRRLIRRGRMRAHYSEGAAHAQVHR